ncbi:MAG: hypothetical protein Q9167_001319 [Letrouitia subvulpina]
MAPESAFLGHPPANDNDYTIVQAFIVSLGLLGKVDPKNGLQFPGPPRPPPDQYHFETTAPKVLVGAAIGSFLMIAVTTARLVVRGRNAKLRYGWDDVFIVLGTLTGLTSPALSFATVAVGGLGKHTYDVTYEEYYYFDRAYWNPKRYATWDHQPKCLPFYGIVKALNTWHILTDGALLISPIVMLWSVQMKLTKKLRVWSVGIVGCVNIVLSIFRIKANNLGADLFCFPTDVYHRVNVWSISELTLGVITASLPVLAVPASKFASLFSSKKSPSPPTSRGGRYFFEKVHRVVRRRHDDSIRLDDSLGTFGSYGLSNSSTRVGAEEERQNGSVSAVQGGDGANSGGGGGGGGGDGDGERRGGDANRTRKGEVTNRWTMEGYKQERQDGDIQRSTEEWDLERGRPAAVEPAAIPAVKLG